MRFLVLQTGSRGNCTYVASEHAQLLIDCGIGIRRIAALLAGHGIDYRAIDAVLVTHLHSDHVGGLGVFLKHVPARVYVHERAALPLTRQLRGVMAVAKRATYRDFELTPFGDRDGFCHRDLDVLPVHVSHDADPTIMYKLHSGKHRAGVLTDLGTVNERHVSLFGDCDALLLEANHCPELLANGPYPLPLKRRIKGDRGHLSNLQASEFASGLARLPGHLLLGHMSDVNNTPAAASAAFNRIETGLIPHATIPQRTCGPILELW